MASGGSGYASASGTSMAAPHVAGAVALLMAQGMTPTAAVNRLLGTLDKVSCGRGCQGRLNLANAVGADPNAPAATAAPSGPATTRPPSAPRTTVPRSTTARPPAAPATTTTSVTVPPGEAQAADPPQMALPVAVPLPAGSSSPAGRGPAGVAAGLLVMVMGTAVVAAWTRRLTA